MKRPFVFGAIGALALGSATLGDVIEVGYFYNTGQGRIHYEGDYAPFVTSDRQGGTGQYTVIHIDLSALLDSVGAHGFTSISTIDTGENIYTGTPGADIDLFRINGLDQSNDVTFVYDGPTTVHQNETAQQLAQRAGTLNWGENGGGDLPSMQFVSLGNQGRLSAVLDEGQIIFENNNDGHGGGSGGGLRDLTLDFSEAGNIESFRIQIEAYSIPSPGAAALLALAGFLAGPRRRR